MAKVKYPFFFSSLVISLFLTFNVHATDTSSAHAYQSGFYAGGSLDYSRLSGHQSYEANFIGGAGKVNIFDRRVLSDNAVGGTLHCGYLYRLDDTNFTISLEPYVGLSPLKDKAKKGGVDATGIANTVRIEDELKRQWTFGAPVKWGYVLGEEFMVYVLTGIEISRFEHKTTITDESGATATGSHKAQKTYAGVLWGAGIEREISEFRVALEAKQVSYGKHKFKHTLTTPYDNADECTVKPSVFSVVIKASYLF